MKGGSKKAAALPIYGTLSEVHVVLKCLDTVRRGITGADETRMGKNLVQLSHMDAGAECACSCRFAASEQAVLTKNKLPRECIPFSVR